MLYCPHVRLFSDASGHDVLQLWYSEEGGSSMKIISTTALAHTVAALRKREGLTHAQLGELPGLSPSLIARLEREDFIPSTVHLQALSSILVS